MTDYLEISPFWKRVSFGLALKPIFVNSVDRAIIKELDRMNDELNTLKAKVNRDDC